MSLSPLSKNVLRNEQLQKNMSKLTLRNSDKDIYNLDSTRKKRKRFNSKVETYTQYNLVINMLHSSPYKIYVSVKPRMTSFSFIAIGWLSSGHTLKNINNHDHFTT